MDAFEVAVYDVEVVDVWAAEEEGETDVPVCLFTGAEDDDVVHVLPFLKKHCACEGCSEGCDFLGVQESAWGSGLVEEC